MDTERFRFVPADAALIADLARQIRREGRDVKYHSRPEAKQSSGET